MIKHKANLKKELNLFEIMVKSNGLTSEQHEMMEAKTKELEEISSKLNSNESKNKTELLGKDKEGFEYWLFSGDKGRIYVKEETKDNKEKWGTYSNIEQIKDLIKSLMNKEFNDKKLKIILKSLLNDKSMFNTDINKEYIL